MPDRPWIIVGFVNPLPVLDHFPPGTVILIEEPDVVRKRDIAKKMAGAPTMRELIEWEYQQQGAADEFHNRYPDLDPALVVPLVEYATPFAARLAERYGRPGASAGAAQIMRDKSLLRKVTRAAGIKNPESEPVDSPAAVSRFMAEHPGPVVLKPANRQASVGTKIVYDPADLEAAWEECTSDGEGYLVPDRPIPLRMLVERYVRGREFSVEMLVREQIPLFTNVTEKVLYPGSRPIELGHTVPAELSAETANMLAEGTKNVVRAVDFRNGIVHCEWILADGEPYLVECAGRFAGDGIPMLIEEAYQIDLARQVYAVLRGEQPQPLPQRAERAAAVRFLRLEPGEVVAVEGVEAAEAVPGVLHVSVDVAPGDVVPELRNSWNRRGSVMTSGNTPGEAVKAAETAIDQIRVVVRQPE